MSLNPKQKRFCKEYLVDHNATQAAIRAGYSKKSAYSQAHDLLKKPELQAEIAKLAKPIAKKIETSAVRVIEDLAEIAHEKKLYKTEHRISALDKLGKHFKLFTDLIETTHTFNQLPAVKVNGKEIELNVGKPRPDR